LQVLLHIWSIQKRCGRVTRRRKAPKWRRECSTRNWRWAPGPWATWSRSWPAWRRRRHAAHRAGYSRSSYGAGTCAPRGMSAVVPRLAASTRAAGRRSHADTAPAGRASSVPAQGWTPAAGRRRRGTIARSCRPPRRRSVKTAAARGRRSRPPTSSRRTTRRHSSSRNGPVRHNSVTCDARSYFGPGPYCYETTNERCCSWVLISKALSFLNRSLWNFFHTY